MKLLFNEIARFIKKYFKLILSFSILLTTIFTTLYIFNYSRSMDENEETGNLVDPYLLDGNAYFSFYIEDENQEAFTNTVLLNQYIRLDEVIEEISSATGTNLAEAYADQENRLILDPIETIPVIEVRRDGQSHLMTLYIRLEDERDNITVADYLLDGLRNNEVPVLEDKEVYIFQDSQIFTESEVATASDVFSVLSLKNIVVVAGVLGVLSLILVIVVLLLKEMFNDKLVYSFTYSTDEATNFTIFNQETGNDYEIQEFLSAPGKKNKLLIAEQKNLESTAVQNLFEKNSTGKLEMNSTTFYTLNKIENITESENIFEIVILVVSGKTTRRWFNEQKRIASLYHKPVKVLQINQ